MRLQISVLLGAVALSSGFAPAAFAQCASSPQGPSQNVCASATSATLTNVVGQVFVSRAGNVTLARSGVVLAAGDRVIARQGAAQITMAGSCVATVEAEGMATLFRSGQQLCSQARSTNPLNNFEAQAQQTGASASAGGTSVGGAAGAPPIAAPVAGATNAGLAASANALPYLIAGGVVAGGIGVFAATSKNSRLSP